ncbi:MAG: uncharacterized protein JWN85_3742 [Gammaproteobacteria bacterium]|nr:uncharacterized protein [Gammaproteobacteria bacterium]
MIMHKRIAAPLVLVFAMACAAPVLAADPTLHQVYEAAQTGHLDEAQQMMNQVLRDHPSSARAHYVEAELSARARDFPRARQELARAQQLDPTLSFARPEAVQALQRELAGGGGLRTAPRSAPAHSAVPWGMIVLIVAVGAILWSILRRRSQARFGYPQSPGAPTTGPGPYGPGGGYGPGGYGPGMGGGGVGSGIMGGLASGLALGAGVAAGEELVRHAIDGREGNVAPGTGESREPPPPENDNLGGSDFGVSDGGGSSWDDGGSFGGGDGGGGGGGDWS